MKNQVNEQVKINITKVENPILAPHLWNYVKGVKKDEIRRIKANI